MHIEGITQPAKLVHLIPGLSLRKKHAFSPVAEQVSAIYPAGWFLIVMPGGVRLVVWSLSARNAPMATSRDVERSVTGSLKMEHAKDAWASASLVEPGDESEDGNARAFDVKDGSWRCPRCH